MAGPAAAGWGCALERGRRGERRFAAPRLPHIPHQAASIAAVMTLLDFTAYSFSAVRLAALFFCWRSQILCSVSFSSVFLRTHVRFPKGVACSKRMESPCSTAVARCVR